MKRSILFLVLLVLLNVAFGCSAGADAPTPHNTLAASASELPRAKGCSVSDADIAAVKFADYPEDTIEAAREEYWKAREENKEVDDRLKENLARVGPALSEKKLAAFVDAFERIGTVGGKKVSEVRARYAAATRGLATVLDAVDANEDIAFRTANGKLLAAYSELAESPCPARAVRFAAILLNLDATPNSPYIALQRQEGSAHGVALLYAAMAGGVVEEGVAANDPDVGLATIRGWVGTASGITGSLTSLLKNREALAAQLSPGAPKIEIQKTDFSGPLRAVSGVLTLWNLNDAIAKRDIEALLRSGPAGVETVSSGVAALGRHFEWARVADAQKVATAAAKIARCLGVVFETKAIVELLISLSDPNTDTQAAVVELGGRVLLLVGTFVPPPLGLAFTLGGTVAILVSRFLRDPPPDELTPLLDELVKQSHLTQRELTALKGARAENMFSLKSKLELTEDEVLWAVTRSPNVVSQGNAFAYVEVLAPIAQKKGKTPIALLKAIAKSTDVEWARFELETFLLHVKRQPSLFQIDDPRKIKEDLLVIKNERFVKDFFDPKFEKRTDGKPLGTADQLLSHARGAIDGAYTSLP